MSSDAPSLRTPVEAPRKPAYGEPCNGCGLCCTATACTLATAFIAEAEEDQPCPALEWADGRSWCGLYRHPERYVTPLLWLTLRSVRARFRASIAGDLFQGGCDSGAPGGIGKDDFLGLTAAEWAAGEGQTGGRKDGSSPQNPEPADA